MFYVYEKVFKIICGMIYKILSKLFALFVGIFCLIILIVFDAGPTAPSITNEFINNRFGFNITEESILLYEVNTYHVFFSQGDYYKVFELSNYDYDNLTNKVFFDKTEGEGESFLQVYFERLIIYTILFRITKYQKNIN